MLVPCWHRCTWGRRFSVELLHLLSSHSPQTGARFWLSVCVIRNWADTRDKKVFNDLKQQKLFICFFEQENPSVRSSYDPLRVQGSRDFRWSWTCWRTVLSCDSSPVPRWLMMSQRLSPEVKQMCEVMKKMLVVTLVRGGTWTSDLLDGCWYLTWPGCRFARGVRSWNWTFDPETGPLIRSDGGTLESLMCVSADVYWSVVCKQHQREDPTTRFKFMSPSDLSSSRNIQLLALYSSLPTGSA